MKHYKLTFTEYHDELEDTDKRITVQYCMSDVEERINNFYLTDIDYELKAKMLRELAMKLGINKQDYINEYGF